MACRVDSSALRASHACVSCEQPFERRVHRLVHASLPDTESFKVKTRAWVPQAAPASLSSAKKRKISNRNTLGGKKY